MLLNKLRKSIKLIVYDFDGVMTDNKVILREDGLESVTVNRSDGLAIGLIKNLPVPQIIITTEKNKVVWARAKKLKIPVLRGIQDKKSELVSYCARQGVSLKHVVYVGNDLNDLEAMKCVGFPICPADACSEVKRISKVVLRAKGGNGVIRELFGLISGKRSVGKSKPRVEHI